MFSVQNKGVCPYYICCVLLSIRYRIDDSDLEDGSSPNTVCQAFHFCVTNTDTTPTLNTEEKSM